jgi:hypothetical protein
MNSTFCIFYIILTLMTVYLILQSLISTYISRLQLNIVYEVNYIIVAFTKLLPPTILISKSFF